MKSLTASLAALCLSTGLATAEPVKWGGFYAGAHGGLDMSSTEVSAPGFTSIDGLSGNGHAYGLHAGYDHQFGMIVVGIGGDFTWSDSDFTIKATGLPTVLRAGIDESWAVYGRIGIDAGRAMPYLLAGYTEADASASILGTKIGSTTLEGWMVGGGVELALGHGIFVGAEYRYTMFDELKLVPGFLHLDTDRHEVRGTLKYKLNVF
jgi:outer membrane immunogenic protein